MMMVILFSEPAGVVGSSVAVGCDAGPHETIASENMTVKVRKSNVRFLVNIGPPANFKFFKRRVLLHELPLLLRFLQDEFAAEAVKSSP